MMGERPDAQGTDAIAFLMLIVLAVIGTFILVIFAAGAEPVARDDLHSPMDAVKLAAKDLQTLPADLQPDARYLSLHAVPSEDREEYKHLLDFILNSLSLKRTLRPSAVVDGSGGMVLRFLIGDYGIDKAALADMAYKGSGPLRLVGKKEKCEPYFYMDITKDGKIITSMAPWVQGTDMQLLVHLTGTDFPIYSGPWFLFHAILPPSYYTLQGITSADEFDKIVRFRQEDTKLLGIRGEVSQSQEVRNNNGLFTRTTTVFGHYYESADFKSSLEEDDALANPLRDDKQEEETLASGLNGLQKYKIHLEDAKGVKTLVNKSDPDLAINRRQQPPGNRWFNKEIVVGATCMFCHPKGIRELTDEVRLTANPRSKISVPIHGREAFEQMETFYGPDLDQQIALDQDRYEAAVQAITGMTGDKLANALELAFVGYIQDGVTMREVSLDTGYGPEKIREALQNIKVADSVPAAGASIAPDRHLGAQLLAGRPLRRDQFENSLFPQLMISMGGQK